MNDILIKILVSVGILVLTNIFVYLSNLSKEKIAKIENIKVREASEKLLDIITKCVSATNQEFVGDLKKEGKFDKDRQEEAWNRTKGKINKILDDESKGILEKAYGDLNSYINQSIEDEITNKKEK
nr:MAG TPA_asm: holin [Caudoviricetes sp.]